MLKRNIKYRSKNYKSANRKNKHNVIYKKYLKGLKTKKHSGKFSSKQTITKRRNKKTIKLRGGDIFTSVPNRMGISPEEMRKREAARKKAAALKAAKLQSTLSRILQQPTTTQQKQLVSSAQTALQHTGVVVNPFPQTPIYTPTYTPITAPTPTPTYTPPRVPIKTFKPGKV
jgi:hypothetical protein